MKNRITMALLFSFSLIAFSGAELKSGGWGTVDTRLVLILHPEMRNYDYIYSRFFRQDITGKATFDVAKELEKGRREYSPELEELQMKRGDFVRKRERVYYDKENQIRDLISPTSGESQILRGRIDRAKKSFAFLKQEGNQDESGPEPRKSPSLSKGEKTKLINGIEAKASEEIRNIEKKLAEIDEEVFQVREKMYSRVYFTASETMGKLHEIKAEIRELIASAATENKIDVIVDSSFGMRPVKKADDLLLNPIQPDSPDVISSAIFNNFANWETPKGLPPGEAGKSLEKHMFPATMIQKNSELKKYLELRHYLKEQAAAFTPGKLFLVGGNDITVLVARKLFSKYRLPEPVKNSFLGVIDGYISFEKASYR